MRQFTEGQGATDFVEQSVNLINLAKRGRSHNEDAGPATVRSIIIPPLIRSTLIKHLERLTGPQTRLTAIVPRVYIGWNYWELITATIVRYRMRLPVRGFW